MSLEDRIREARGALTQDQLADRIRALGDPRFASTNGKRVGEWENGAPRLAFYIVAAIARATGRPLEFFAEWPTPLNGAIVPAEDPGLAAAARNLLAAAEEYAARARRESGGG